MQWLRGERRAQRSLAVVAAILGAALVSTSVFAKEKIEENAETPYLARDFVFVESPAIEEYLRAICQRMLDAKGVQMEIPRILVQSSDAFNAFTDANRNLIISTGALRSIESEDELAALLGHELAHLVLKHPQDKDAMRSLPLGLQSTASFRDAAAELKGQKATHVSDLSKFDPNHMNEAQATSVLWSDFVSPSWNRGQEREADEQGFELMRAAGYDPSAFGQLFSKLQAAEAKRSERMQVLKKALVTQLRETGKTAVPRSGAKGDALTLTSDVKNSAADTASEKLVDGLAAFNRSYESPDERQAALSAYAREHREKKRAPRPEVKFTQVLQGGAGADLLKIDAAALGTMDALAARNAAAAKKAAEGLGGDDAKPASSHLYLAKGSYHQVYGNKELGERCAQAWVESTRPPAQAYIWFAAYQGQRRDFTAAISTLESGRQRVGNSARFLPSLVAMARAGGNLPLARDYARECKAESNRDAGEALKSFVSDNDKPAGLYAECVRQLGEVPKDDAVTESIKGKTRELGRKLFDKL
jgi:Zn-dependent protease with chaperone function